MEDANKLNQVHNKPNEAPMKTEEAFFDEAEKVVNRLLKQYDSLLELSKKHHAEDKDINYMFNAIKKYHDATKKTYKDSDKDNGFSFKK